ncbi:His-Xaa-Ser system radical SAM maturase HxsB [Xanthobacteraceae bacterium Astr-EGSB]|uniref:His-Xaa-Ser system radical SAM maturase HxsB n=1 Tax=Astrobacterium formosum TaxID=3069710 RepID=UPI0027B817EA|nr:His-Xaa-Ser system radical SAM maturase HxsB [Xanthobacteraceae bacterium Astr-EGSB]
MANTEFVAQSGFVEAGSYQLMPLRFGHIAGDRVLLTSPSGEYAVLPRTKFEDFICGRLDHESPEYFDLKARHFLTHTSSATLLRVLASQIRTKKEFLRGGPKLHIFVPTLRCNQSCGYCQASRANADAVGFDMTKTVASRAIDLMLSSPSPAVTMEFQGGEPLLAFDLVRWMVTETKKRAADSKTVSYVICTSLNLLNDEHLSFFKEEGVFVSTSLDGPAAVHDKNRPLAGPSSHSAAVRNIRRCQEALGEDRVSALMTTTRHSLSKGKEIVDEYIRLGQRSIFLRELNPYGYAAKTTKSIGYTVPEFIRFYRETLNYIIDINRKGTFFAEGYASILIKKIITPFGVGFVDLQSPTGEGFGVVLYNHDGAVYASDEARMLAEMGDRTFQLGTVNDRYLDLFLGETMQQLAAAGCAEALPGCADCVYVPYCGADPIRHYRTQADLIGHRPTSSFCNKQTEIFKLLFELLNDSSQEVVNILVSWIVPTRRQMPKPSWQFQ